MSQLPVRFLVLFGAVALVLVVLCLPGLVPIHGQSDVAVDWIDEDQAKALSQELDLEKAVVAQRIELKQQLVQQLIEGHLTLIQVATEFLRMNAESEQSLAIVREAYAGETDVEKSARNVIHYALSQNLSPKTRQSVQERLEREFEQQFRSTPNQP